MSQNDEKIRKVLSIIEEKKSKIGIKPKALWKSNGIINVVSPAVNINVLNKLEDCINVTSHILKLKYFKKEAIKLLDIDYIEHIDSTLDDYLDDLKLRAGMIKWDIEKKKLDSYENKLKDLRSDAAKTADAIEDMMADLT